MADVPVNKMGAILVQYASKSFVFNGKGGVTDKRPPDAMLILRLSLRV